MLARSVGVQAMTGRYDIDSHSRYDETWNPVGLSALTSVPAGSRASAVVGGQTRRQDRILKRSSARSIADDRANLEQAGVATNPLDTTAGWQARERLIAELQLFRDVAAETVERMPLGFVALDHGLQATYANPVALALVGLSLSDLVGRRPWDLFPQIVGTRYQTVKVSAAITVEYEEQIGPRERWVGVLACPIQTGTAVFLRDITERKRAEQTVRRSVALTHGSLDPTRDAFLLCSAVRDGEGVIVDFRVEFGNGVAGAFMSRTPDALMGALTSAMTPDWAANLGQKSFLDVCRGVIETGEAWADEAVEFALPGLGGADTHGTLSIQITRFNDGFFATWRDVTESQRQARERERLVAVVEQSLDGIIIADAAGLVTYVNPAFRAGGSSAGRSTHHWCALPSVESDNWNHGCRPEQEAAMGRRGYPPEFRRRVLDLLATGRRAVDLARDLGISDQTIYVWRRQERIDRGWSRA